MMPASASAATWPSSSPRSDRSTSAVCSPIHGTRPSDSSGTLESFTGFPGTRTGCWTPSVRGRDTSMLRAARCGSRITSCDSKQGPAATPAAINAWAASSFVRSAAHFSIPGRMTSSKCSPHPARSARRGSSSHSPCPTVSARRSNWCSRTSWITNQPSDARNVSRM